jgi:DNA-directed RNA polymerase specialized sigma24 family protein
VANQTGDSGSFEELAMPLFARLYNFACWLAHDRVAAEDLVQETFMKL